MQRRSLEAAEPGILNSVMTRCARSEPCLAERLTRFGQVQGMSGWGAQVFVMYSGGGAKQLRSLRFTRWRWGIMTVS